MKEIHKLRFEMKLLENQVRILWRHIDCKNRKIKSLGFNRKLRAKIYEIIDVLNGLLKYDNEKNTRVPYGSNA